MAARARLGSARLGSGPGKAIEEFDTEAEARAEFDTNYRLGTYKRGKLIMVVEIESRTYSRS